MGNHLLEPQMVNGWMMERCKRQSALIRTCRPWEKSTGPRTPEGKARSTKRLQGYSNDAARSRALRYLLGLLGGTRDHPAQVHAIAALHKSLNRGTV
jgi:hypothetical protein